MGLVSNVVESKITILLHRDKLRRDETQQTNGLPTHLITHIPKREEKDIYKSTDPSESTVNGPFLTIIVRIS